MTEVIVIGVGIFALIIVIGAFLWGDKNYTIKSQRKVIKIKNKFIKAQKEHIEAQDTYVESMEITIKAQKELLDAYQSRKKTADTMIKNLEKIVKLSDKRNKKNMLLLSVLYDKFPPEVQKMIDEQLQEKNYDEKIAADNT